MPIVVAVIGLAALAVLHEVVFRFGRQRWHGALAIGAAVGASYLAISTITFTHLAVNGVPTGTHRYVVDRVAEGFDAVGKLQVDDRIVAADGVAITPASSLTRIVNERGGQPVVVTVERRGAMLDVEVRPQQRDGNWLLGIRPRIESAVVFDVAAAADIAIGFPIVRLGALAGELKDLMFGADAADPSGPKRIVDEYPVRPPPMMRMIAPLLAWSVLALVLHLVVDIVRLLRRR